MEKRHRIFYIIAVIVLLPLLGYGIPYGLNLAVPMSENGTPYHLFYYIFLIAVVLAVPYWMLKLMSRAAHKVNPEEKEMQLEDVPKDKEEMRRSQQH